MATEARTPLSREAIVELALAKADAGGVEAISFRRLAAEFGVTPMALYRYVGSKEELLDAITDRVFAEFELPHEQEVADWRDGLRMLARSFRRVLVAHPVIASIHRAGIQPHSDNGLRIMEVLLGFLRAAGFSTKESALLEGNLERYILALALLETGGAAPAPAGEEEVRVRADRARLLSLQPLEFPHTVEAAEYLCEHPDPEWAFEFTLDLLVGGLESLLADRRDDRV